jgi:hypothetical protein
MRPVFLLLLIGLIPTAVPPSFDEPPTIDRIEEDWELIIKSTDVPAAGPQITTTMCPGPQEDHPDVNFNLNYRAYPDFVPGGLEIQACDGQDVLATTTSRNGVLQTENETITWTQRITLSGGSVEYQVRSGQSTTWGSFGGEELSVSFTSGLSDLSGYDSEVSLNKSGVGWQSDHVASMRLMAVRSYSGDMLISTNNTPRTIHPTELP